MPNVYIHSSTQQHLDSITRDLPQSIVLTGPEGVGLSAAVSYIADKLQAKPIYILPEKDEKTDIEKGTITVDIIRRLYAMTKTIETGKRLIVIDYAERMATQAQNAFLKLLEEPGANTHFILLTHATSKLLPTIQSRVQITEVNPISLTQSESLLDELKVTDTQKRAQLLFIAAGLPALLTVLSTDEKLFEARAQIIRDARAYLQGSAYNRLTLALAYKDNRQGALTLLLDAMRLLQGSLKTGQNPDQVKKISLLLKAHERIEANGNVRLQLASVVL
jgi:DNA polymerase III delta prime subunit